MEFAFAFYWIGFLLGIYLCERYVLPRL